jgi:hypothetical protein
VLKTNARTAVAAEVEWWQIMQNIMGLQVVHKDLAIFWEPEGVAMSAGGHFVNKQGNPLGT